MFDYRRVFWCPGSTFHQGLSGFQAEVHGYIGCDPICGQIWVSLRWTKSQKSWSALSRLADPGSQGRISCVVFAAWPVRPRQRQGTPAVSTMNSTWSWYDGRPIFTILRWFPVWNTRETWCSLILLAPHGAPQSPTSAPGGISLTWMSLVGRKCLEPMWSLEEHEFRPILQASRILPQI